MDNTDEVDCVISTQWQSRAQKDISSVLGVAQNKVHVRTKRLGGAFGGKETSNVIPAVAAAVAAVKFNRPVRIVLERDEDMLHTGTRHPSQFHYKIGFNKDGKVIAYQGIQDFTAPYRRLLEGMRMLEGIDGRTEMVMDIDQVVNSIMENLHYSIVQDYKLTTLSY